MNADIREANKKIFKEANERMKQARNRYAVYIGRAKAAGDKLMTEKLQNEVAEINKVISDLDKVINKL